MKRLSLLFFLSVIFYSFAFSHGAAMHDEIFYYILFEQDVQLNTKEQEKMSLLYYSSRVAIDQYNGSYENELNYLKSKGIKTIPDIAVIDYTGNSHHQRYTHRGWTFEYSRDLGNWVARKQLILDTTQKVFSFESEEQHEAFSAFMYYIHILGDHDGDKKDNSMDRIALGGRADQIDILDELSSIYLPKLFKSQKDKVNYLCERLQNINRKCSNLLRRTGDGYDDRNVKRDVKELSDEEYIIYQRYAKETLKVLTEEVPNLLLNEKWFVKAFPSVKKK